jgi:hypothetical protein
MRCIGFRSSYRCSPADRRRCAQGSQGLAIFSLMSDGDAILRSPTRLHLDRAAQQRNYILTMRGSASAPKLPTNERGRDRRIQARRLTAHRSEARL